MDVEDLGTTKRGKEGFGSGDFNPKRSITAKEEGGKICFLLTESGKNEFFRATNISYHPQVI